MDRKNRRFPIVMIVLMLLSLTCNIPLGKNAGGSETAEPEPMKIIDQAVYTSDAAEHAAGYFIHPETADLLDLVQSEGYTSIVESGDFTFSNGGKMHAVSLSDGKTLVILVQIETNTGTRDALIVEIIDEHTVLYRDKSGSVEIAIDEEGEVRYESRDAVGKPISIAPSSGSQFKLASVEPQAVNACTTGMGVDFDECIREKYNLGVTEECAAGTAALAMICMSPPFADCIFAFAAYYTYCWLDFNQCLGKMLDDPPSFEYSSEQIVEPYAYCQEDTLFKDNLYQVQVECNDDRQPKPANFTVNLTSGEAKEFTCTDCSGQTSSGTIPPPGEVTSMVCEYGCLAVGEGKDRCLNEGETPSLGETSAGNTSDRVGTYIASTGFCAPFIEDWSLSVAKDELTIIIDDQGSISGSMDVLCEGTLSEPISWGDDNSRNCRVQINMSAVGTLSGRLDDSGETGMFELAVVETKEIIRIDCPAGTEKTPYQFNLTVNFEFFGDALVGVVPDFISFEATRQ